jgi:hypothetical protein
MQEHYITGYLDTPIGIIPQISTIWENVDVWNTIKVRWSIGRMNYKVDPGLYAVGEPNENSDVFATANFKLSFDHLRRALHGIEAWVLVLDTKGINVWCAAGKGTFGTKELVHRIQLYELNRIINHRKVIVPQLGATGVSAHEVKSQSGFNVIYGPIRAADIKDYVSLGYKATAEMRKVNFPLKERMKLIPVEIVNGGYYLLLIPALFFILSGLNTNGYSIDLAWTNGGKSIINLFAAYLAGCAITPILLPYIPFTRFSLKGIMIGWLIAILLLYFNLLGNSIFEIISWFLMIGGLSSFLAMTFTGTTTFTSLSGVQKEMKTAVPMQIGFAGLGFIGWMVTRFI